jgi:hypothetical protein
MASLRHRFFEQRPKVAAEIRRYSASEPAGCAAGGFLALDGGPCSKKAVTVRNRNKTQNNDDGGRDKTPKRPEKLR